MADPTKTDIARALEGNNWFRRQTPDIKRALVEQAQAVRADKGRWLYDVGDDARGLYGVLTGSVRILVQMTDGDYALSNIVGRGAIFGYAGRLVGKKRLVTAEVRERSTLIYVPEAGLEAIARKTPDIWVHFAELASDHLVAATRAMIVNAREAPEARIWMHLRLLTNDEPLPLDIHISQDELAELSGLSRKTVNIVLKELQAKGLIETGYRKVTVLKAERMRAG